MYWCYSHEFFVGLLRRATPERIPEVDAILHRHSLVFVPKMQLENIEFSVNLVTREVTISTEPIARLWAHAYAYLWMYTAISGHKNGNPDAGVLEFSTDGNLKEAAELLKWATREDIEILIALQDGEIRQSRHYPAGLPLPFDSSVRDSHARLANDLVLMAVANILFHEIAHVELRYGPTNWPGPIQEEKEADSWAARFMLEHVADYCRQPYPGRADSEEMVRTKRLLGIILGFFWLVMFECHLDVAPSREHPPSYDRLFRLLDEHAQDPNHLGWCMASVVLGVHLQSADPSSAPTVSFNSFRDCVKYYCDYISRKQITL